MNILYRQNIKLIKPLMNYEHKMLILFTIYYMHIDLNF